MSDLASTDNALPVPMPVKAGHGHALAGAWLGLLDNRNRLVFPSVAHFLFNRRGNLRTPVSIKGIEVNLEQFIPLIQNRIHTADAALFSASLETIQSGFFAVAGLLNIFLPKLPVFGVRCSGRILRGRLISENWSGNMIYSFGSRRLANQWIIRLDPGFQENRSCAGDSGMIWTTFDGFIVGIQAGILREKPDYIIVTPFCIVCDLFEVAIAPSTNL